MIKSAILYNYYNSSISTLIRPKLIKNLDVAFDPKLKFTSLIEKTAASAYQVLTIFSRNMRLFNEFSTMEIHWFCQN